MNLTSFGLVPGPLAKLPQTDLRSLAWRAIPVRGIVVDAVIPRVQAIDDGEGDRSATLDESPAQVKVEFPKSSWRRDAAA